MRRLLLIQKDPSVLEGQGQEWVGRSNEEIKMRRSLRQIIRRLLKYYLINLLISP